MKIDNSVLKAQLDVATQKRLQEILKTMHTALIFQTELSAKRNIKEDYIAIKKGSGTVTYHTALMCLQMGLKPITMLWYMCEDNCIGKLNKTKFHKIIFVDFEADAILKEFSKTRLEAVQKLFMVKDAIKQGIK